MDSGIHFGDLAESSPQTRLRPDRNQHLAVVPVGPPDDADLPIFVDIDVLREMEAHALSDPRVELGGVLLGGQFADDAGRPFVQVTDSLRAQHYQSTRGSFKFTHETWEQITREREKFPSELQMVGWYHTHPDWGVFLSGLDMFICENFFNRPLDVALVIDPCRQDRGFFQWTQGEQPRIRRTDGFYLTGSRFRAGELQSFAAQLEGHAHMTPANPSPSPYPPAVIHVSSPSPSWQVLSVLCLLSIQFCMLLVMALRLVPAAGSSRNDETSAAQPAASGPAEAMRRREADIDAKLEVLELVIRQGNAAPEGILKSLAREIAQVEELRSSLRGQQSLTRELDRRVVELEASLSDSRRREERRQSEMASLQARLTEATTQREALRSELQGASQATGAASRSWWSWLRANSAPLGCGALLGAAAVGLVLAAVQHTRKPAQGFPGTSAPDTASE